MSASQVTFQRGEQLAVLGTGSANGACSLLHAAGLGYGASIGLDLPVAVRCLDKPSKREILDPDHLLPAVIDAWLSAEFPLPNGLSKDEIHWAIMSKIPPRQGLKSSAAIAIAALKALADATNSEVEDELFVSMAANAQISANVSITGSIDDAWACLTPGWKLINPQAASISEGLVLEGNGPDKNEWAVMVACRGDRKQRPQLEDFTDHGASFQKALSALQEGNELVAITWNGRGVVSVMNDVPGRKITNDAMMNGARSAGMTGSGNAIVVVAPKVSEPTCERLRKWLASHRDVEKVIETSFVTKQIAEDASS